MEWIPTVFFIGPQANSSLCFPTARILLVLGAPFIEEIDQCSGALHNMRKLATRERIKGAAIGHNASTILRAQDLRAMFLLFWVQPSFTDCLGDMRLNLLYLRVFFSSFFPSLTLVITFVFHVIAI